MRLRAPRGKLDLLGGGLGLGIGDVGRDGVREQEAVVGDEGDLRPQRGQVHVADVGAVDHDAPLARVVEPREQSDEAGLPGSRGADEGHGPAGVDLEVDPGQRGFVAVVAQAHPSQLDAAVTGGERRCPGGILHCRLAVEDLEQAVPRRDCALGHAQRHPQPAHRAREHDHVGRHRGELADVDRPVDDLAPSDHDHRREPDRRQEAHQRRVEGLKARGDHALLEDPVDGGRKRSRMNPSRANALTMRMPEMFSSAEAVTSPTAPPDFLLGRTVSAAVAGRDCDQERHGRQGKQGQQRVDHDHRDRREGDCEEALRNHNQP